MIDMQNHPLMNRGVSSCLHNLGSWKKRWDEEMAREYPLTEVLMGLLHVVFKQFTDEKLVCLCFEVADGHNGSKSDFNDHYLSWHDRGRGRTVQWYPKWEVAQKAWKVLCDNVFKNTARDFESPSWAYLVVQPEIFHKLMWFFRVAKCNDDNIPSIHNPNHYDTIALKFLREFIIFAWTFRSNKSYCEAYSDEAKKWAEQALKMFTDARPQFVEILERINGLKLLLHRDIEIDDPTYQKLEEIALQSLHTGEEPPGSLEEAYATNPDGARAAKLLILLDAYREGEECIRRRTAENQK